MSSKLAPIEGCKNLSDAILYYAAHRPDLPAVIDGEKTLDYRSFATLVLKASSYLRDLGITRGDRIGIVLPNGAQHFILVFALIRLGAVLTEMPVEDTPAARADKAGMLGLRKFFAEEEVVLPPEAVAFRVDAKWQATIDGCPADDSEAALEPRFVIMTSGSTGQPKGMLLPHSHFVERLDTYAKYLYDGELPRPGRSAPLLLTATVAYAGFFKKVMAQLCCGGPVVVITRTGSASQLVEEIASWDDAICPVTPFLCRQFLQHAPTRGLLFPRLRALLSAGDALYPEEKCRIIEAVTPNLRESYGTSATGSISCLRSQEVLAKPASVGRPWPTVEVEIVDLNDVPLARSEIGRIRVRAPGMAAGYHDGRTMIGYEGFRNGWYYPGELGTLHADGYLYIKGRAAQVIRRNGKAVFAAEIEQVLVSHPGVQQAAAIGMSADGPDQQAIAVVVLRGEVSHAELVRLCFDRLPPGKRPNGICYAQSLPMLPAGKVDVNRLREMIIARIEDAS